jgi:tRNA(Ile)-lysidine synthase
MNALLADVARATPDTPLLVAFSGGLDSTVLLHLLAADANVRARGLRALHVRHDLQSAAAAWEMHCRRVCAALGIELQVLAVQVARDSGLGLEAAARAARHSAFAAELRAGETLVLAHHRDDQAETVLLRLLRASGSDGLAAMRALRDFGQGRLWRPLLDIPRAQLLAQARALGLEWIEDPSNADEHHDRNYLRHRVLPLLDARWPGAGAALARSAQLLAEDAQLLEDEAARRLLAARTADPATLATAPLLALSPAWRARALRHWLATLALPPPPGRAFARVDAELLGSRHDAQPELRWAGLRLQRWRGLLHVEPEQPALARDFECAWDGRAPLLLPGGDHLELGASADASALPPALAPLRVAARQGGERIRLEGRGHSHALKDCLQRAALPPWLRRRLPLLHAPDAELLAAGDTVLSARWQREVAAQGLHLRWRAAAWRD